MRSRSSAEKGSLRARSYPPGTNAVHSCGRGTLGTSRWHVYGNEAAAFPTTRHSSEPTSSALTYSIPAHPCENGSDAFDRTRRAEAAVCLLAFSYGRE